MAEVDLTGAGMSYVINLYRKPKPGNFKTVLDAAIASLDATVEATGKRGFITGTMSHPNPTQGSNLIVTSTGGFETVEELDSFMDAAGANSEMFARVDKANSQCDSFSSEISRILPRQSKIPEIFDPKWVMRDIQVAKPGQLPAVIEYLSEWREEGIGVPTVLVLNVPLGKVNLSALRLTFFFESLADMEAGDANIMSNPKLPGLIDMLEGSPTRVISRILHRRGF